MSGINDEAALRAALRRLREEKPQSASARTEERIRDALRNRRVHRRWRWAAAACLALGLGSWSLWWSAGPRRTHPAEATASLAQQGFVELPYAQSDVPLEHALVVRVEVDAGAGPVAADVLVGQDGVARAVRLAQ